MHVLTGTSCLLLDARCLVPCVRWLRIPFATTQVSTPNV